MQELPVCHRTSPSLDATSQRVDRDQWGVPGGSADTYTYKGCNHCTLTLSVKIPYLAGALAGKTHLLYCVC